MVLEIHLGEGYALEKHHSRKVWRRARRMVVSAKEGRLCCWLVEVNKKRVGSFKVRTRFERGCGRKIRFWH